MQTVKTTMSDCNILRSAARCFHLQNSKSLFLVFKNLIICLMHVQTLILPQPDDMSADRRNWTVDADWSVPGIPITKMRTAKQRLRM